MFPSLFVTLIVTAFPAVTLLKTEEGTATVAAVSLEGVTVTFALILSADCTKFTTKLDDKKLVPAKVKVVVAPSAILPVTLDKVGTAEEIFFQLTPSE